MEKKYICGCVLRDDKYFTDLPICDVHWRFYKDYVQANLDRLAQEIIKNHNTD